jgi:hypothetical protein
VLRRNWVLTPAQEEVIDRLGEVRIGERLLSDRVYVYQEKSGRTVRYLLAADGEVIRKDDLGPTDTPPSLGRR